MHLSIPRNKAWAKKMISALIKYSLRSVRGRCLRFVLFLVFVFFAMQLTAEGYRRIDGQEKKNPFLIKGYVNIASSEGEGAKFSESIDHSHEAHMIDLGYLTLFHFNRPCICGNNDGLYLSENELRSVTFENEKIFKSTISPLKVRSSEQSRVKSVIKGATYFVNCWRQTKSRRNPSHWAMKILSLFYISYKVSRGEWKAPMFDQVFFHQCPESSSWDWGSLVWNLSTRDWAKYKLVKDSIETMGSFTDERIQDNGDVCLEGLTCFEQLYLDSKYTRWFVPGTADMWREPLTRRYDWRPGPGLRVRIFQRSSGENGNRRILNINQVQGFVEKLTGGQPDIITLNESTSAEDQMKLFNDFDVLISSHGSQLTNLIFSSHPLAVMEVIPCVKDLAFTLNAQALGHAYVLSSGHSVPESCKGKEQLLLDVKRTPSNEMVRCYNAGQTKSCDIIIKEDIFIRDLALVIRQARQFKATQKLDFIS